MGSWNHWQTPGIPATSIEPGFWRTAPQKLKSGQYAYKFLLDGQIWLDDPSNPQKIHDGSGGLNSVLIIPS